MVRPPSHLLATISSAFVAGISLGQGSTPSESRKTLRDRLLEMIRLKPGIRMSALWQTLHADRGTAKYHLLLLEKSHEVEAVRSKRLTRYFPVDTAPQQRVALSLLRHGRVLEVARVVAERPGVAQRDIATMLPISRKVFRRYANMLIACQLLEEVAEDQQRYYYPTPQLRRLLEVLGEEDAVGDTVHKPGDGP